MSMPSHADVIVLNRRPGPALRPGDLLAERRPLRAPGPGKVVGDRDHKFSGTGHRDGLGCQFPVGSCRQAGRAGGEAYLMIDRIHSRISAPVGLAVSTELLPSGTSPGPAAT